MLTMTMTKLGKKGRFANQLLQYAYLRIQSKDDYQCPPWIGQHLFGLNDPPVTRGTPELSYKFPLNSSWYAPHKEFFQSLFVPVPEIRFLLAKQIGELRHAGHTIIGLHLRRGDYGTFTRPSARWCFIAPTIWYLDWLKENAGRLANPVLYIASDDLDAVLPDFYDYKAVTAETFLPSAPYYPDFYALTQCDVLLISNSTFGFAASMLNERATEFYRPRLSQKKLIPYQPWDSEMVFLDERY